MFENYKKIYKNDSEMMFNMQAVYLLVSDEYFDMSQADRLTVVSCIGYLMDGLDVTDWKCFENDISPEQYIFDAIKCYLADGHTVYELDNLEDDSEVFDYL